VPPSLHSDQTGRPGVSRVTSLATPDFLASAAGTLSLQDQILEVCACQTDSHFTLYLTQWSASFGPPPDPMPSKSLSGTNLEFWRIVPLSKLLWSISRRWHATWLQWRHTVATQRLAVSLAKRQLRTPARRRGSTGGCWHAARTDYVCPPQMSLRVRRRQSRADTQWSARRPGRVATH